MVYRQLAELKDYGFKDRISRAALSIPSNIAEGMEKEPGKDQVRFLDIAKGSAAEFATQTWIGMEIEYIPREIGASWVKNRPTNYGHAHQPAQESQGQT